MMKYADTHRHLGGSISPEFIWSVIKGQSQYKYLAESLEDVIDQMTYKNFGSDSIKNYFHYFLNKFKILDEIEWTEDLIEDTIKHICDDFQKEGLYGVLLDFSVNKYMKIGWHKHQAIKFIKECFNHYSKDVKVGLLLSIKYESPTTALKQHIKSIEHNDVIDSVVGLDMVGDEDYYNPNILIDHFQDWKDAGKLVRTHVGEVGGVDNIISAIKDLEVTNIAHGINIVTSQEAIELAKERNIQFDLGLIGNLYTNVVKTAQHPVADMVYNGLNVTIGTDDPHIFNTDLDKEYEYLSKSLLNGDTHSADRIRQLGIDTIDRWVK